MKKILILVCLFSIYSNAKASVFIEPFAGTILNGEIKDNLSTCTINCTDDVSGSQYGLRFGLDYFGFLLGLDYRMGTYSLKEADIDIKQTGSTGLLVGYELPILIRFWYVHGLASSLEASAGSADITYSTKSSQVIGIGYTGLPLISINFEMISENLDQIDNSLSGKSDSDIDLTSSVLSVSFPFSF